MDQYPFEFNFIVIGLEVDDFVKMLKKSGYDEQAKQVEIQFEKQIKDI